MSEVEQPSGVWEHLGEALRDVLVRCPGGDVSVPMGTPVREALERVGGASSEPYIGALLNHRLVDLDEPIWGAAHCRGVTLEDDWMGASIYRRSATLILYEAAKELFPEMQLLNGQSLGNGYHFSLDTPPPDDEHWVQRLEERCCEIIAQKRPFRRSVVTIDEATALFRAQQSEDKVKLLRVWSTDLVHVVTLGSYYDIQHGPVAPTTGHIHSLCLIPFPQGFVLEFEDLLRVGIGKHPSEQMALFRAYQETRKWNQILGVTTVGQLNELALQGKMSEIIQIAEGFHEKKIAAIADRIAVRDGVRFITIAGPSSAGKTTFARRLGIQMRVNGMHPVAISLDDYYHNREDMPRFPHGGHDFESIDALDLTLFNEHLEKLLKGEEIIQPHYDFTKGRRMDESAWTPLRLRPEQILVIEGIHGLNPRLSEAVPEEAMFRIFINALTQLNLDRSNRLFTSETRLLRRIVRDRRYRAYSADLTIKKWDEVREGERKYIFPFQESADTMFNSALIYESSVLKMFAERYLLEVSRSDPTAPFAHRLRNFLQLFVAIEPHEVPPTSILREFIGDALLY